MNNTALGTLGLTALLALSVGLSGCHNDEARTSAGEAAQKEEGGITFKSKEGLSVPEDIARHIGLKLADVTERKINGQLAFTAQVYGETGPQARRVALASAWMVPALAKSIPSGTDIVATTSDTNFFTGVVTRLVAAANTNSPVEVLLELHAEPGQLKVGDFVQVTVTTTGQEAVVVVPRAALLRTPEGHFVYVANGKHLIRAAVKVGGEQDGFVEIKSGLLPGDKIVLAGVSMLRSAELHIVLGGDACCRPH